LIWPRKLPPSTHIRPSSSKQQTHLHWHSSLPSPSTTSILFFPSFHRIPHRHPEFSSEAAVSSACLSPFKLNRAYPVLHQTYQPRIDDLSSLPHLPIFHPSSPLASRLILSYACFDLGTSKQRARLHSKPTNSHHKHHKHHKQPRVSRLHYSRCYSSGTTNTC
jgi:hypothetical protein